mgnify:CR=1 FL=1
MSKDFAIIYWGMLRSLPSVYESHKRNIYNILESNKFTYDVYAHTWNAKEHYVWTNKSNNEIDNSNINILNCKEYEIGDQDEFLENLDFSLYFKQHIYDKHGVARSLNFRGEWDPQLLKNHLCALESLKKSFTLAETSDTKYKYVMFVRPDIRYTTPINSDWIRGLKDKEIILSQREAWDGANDRWGIINYKDADIYAKRIDKAAEYRNRPQNQRISAESYLHHTLKVNQIKIISVDLRHSIIR